VDKVRNIYAGWCAGRLGKYRAVSGRKEREVVGEADGSGKWDQECGDGYVRSARRRSFGGWRGCWAGGEND